jgi:hypothetical protein
MITSEDGPILWAATIRWLTITAVETMQPRHSRPSPSAAVTTTRQMFDRSKTQSKKASQWRNSNNLRYEALRCVIALQATKPGAAVPFREDVVHCLRCSDASLRHLAAEVLYNSCSSENLCGVVEQVRCLSPEQWWAPPSCPLRGCVLIVCVLTADLVATC